MKKRFNRLVSLLVTAVMLLSMITVVNVSADTPADLITEGIDMSVHATKNKGIYGITSTVAHNGLRSLYMNALKNQISLGNYTDFGLQKGTNYAMKFSIRIEQNGTDGFKIKQNKSNLGSNHSLYYTALNGTSETGITFAGNCNKGWQITTEDDGWYTFESKCPIYISETADASSYVNEMFDGFEKSEVYIDDIEFYLWKNFDENGTVIKETYSADNFSELCAKRDFEEIDTTPEDLTNENVGLTVHSAKNKGIYGITSTVSHSGSRSLYMSSIKNQISLGSYTDFGLQKATAYAMKFSIRVDRNVEEGFKIKQNNSNLGATHALYYTTISGTSETGLTLAGNCNQGWQVTQEDDGWYTFESKCPIYISADADDANRAGEMFDGFDKAEVYLDDIEFYVWKNFDENGAVIKETYSANNFTELYEKKDFEVKQPTPQPQDLTTEGLRLTVSATKNKGIYGITSTLAHNGSRSLYMNALKNQIAIGSYTDFELKKGTPYALKFSLRVEQNATEGFKLRQNNSNLGTTHAANYTAISGTSDTGLTYTGNCNKAWKITREKNGWYTFESNCPVYISPTADITVKAGEMFDGFEKSEVYIDDIEFYVWKNFDENGAVIKEIYSADNFTELYDKRDFEVKQPTPQPQDLTTEGIGMTVHATKKKGIYGITAEVAHNSSRSLYMNALKNQISLGSYTDFGLQKGTNYAMKFSIKIVQNVAEGFKIKQNNSSLGSTHAVNYTAISGTSETGITFAGNCSKGWQITGGKDGWYTFESKCPIYIDVNADLTTRAGEMFDGFEKSEVYIDDIEFYLWKNFDESGAVIKETYSEENFTDLVVRKDFELVGSYISEFKKAVNGDDVTVSVDIRNCDKDNLTAQLFLAIYDGETLLSMVMTDAKAIAKVGEKDAPTTLSKTVTVPAGKTMTMFLWNSLEGMMPLRRCATYTAVQ